MTRDEPRELDSSLPAWIQKAAAVLYDQMEAIDGQAMNDGQVDQSEESHRFTWTLLVGNVIAAEFYRSKRR